MPTPDISVCICTRDRLDYLRACLDGLAAQTAPPDSFEILVVDSGSSPDPASGIAALVSSTPNARLVRLDQPGLSLARNAGARDARGTYVAYIDDDALPAPDWVEAIRHAIAQASRPPAVLAGRILPAFEAPLPRWWPAQLRGVLTIIEFDGKGEFRSSELPGTLEPYGANMIVRREAMLGVGGFSESTGRTGLSMLSDEDVQLAWALQNAGESVRYDGAIVVRHSIQATRLNPAWLLSRLYWQGVSTVITRKLLGDRRFVARRLARRLLVAALLSPTAAIPSRSTFLIGLRWRQAYSLGFVAAALRPAGAGSSPPRT